MPATGCLHIPSPMDRWHDHRHLCSTSASLAPCCARAGHHTQHKSGALVSGTAPLALPCSLPAAVPLDAASWKQGRNWSTSALSTPAAMWKRCSKSRQLLTLGWPKTGCYCPTSHFMLVLPQPNCQDLVLLPLAAGCTHNLPLDLLL